MKVINEIDILAVKDKLGFQSTEGREVILNVISSDLPSNLSLTSSLTSTDNKTIVLKHGDWEILVSASELMIAINNAICK